MEFKDKIKELRRAKKLTQQEVGEGTGLSTSSIGMYEQGRRKPSFDVLKTFSEFFKVDLNTLLDDTVNELPVAAKRDEAQIADDLEKILEDIDSDLYLGPHEGTASYNEDRELLKSALQTSMRIAKRMVRERNSLKEYELNSKNKSKD